MDSLTEPTPLEGLLPPAPAPDPLEGVIIPPEGGPSELVLLKRDPESIFLDEAFIKAVLAEIATRATNFKPDTSTDKGRKQIASMAYRVSQTKTYIDSIGKDLVADLKDKPKKVDAGRRTFRDRLDLLRDEVRQPLTDHETRVEAIQTRLKSMRDLPATMADASADQLEAQAKALATTPTGAGDWDEFGPEALSTRDQAVAALREMVGKARALEAEQAELARLREDKAKRDQADHEERIRKEAADKERQAAEQRAQAERDAAARREGEAKLAQQQAEQRQKDAEARLEQEKKDAAAREVLAREQASAEERQRQENQQRQERSAQEARERDKANRGRVLNEALDTLKAAVPEMDERHAKATLMAIAQGQIKHTRIEF